MTDHQTETSRYAACLTDFLPSFGRALLLSAVDFTPTGWTTEHSLLPPADAPIKGASIHTSFDPVSIPRELIPTPEDELTRGLDLASSLLTTTIFERDRVLCRELMPPAKFIRPPLTPKGIALLHLTGEFSRGLGQARDNTRCGALKKFLTEILRYNRFKTE
jgi:hypothetical protein